MYEKLIEALRLCVKYGKANDALANAEPAADAIETMREMVATAHNELANVIQDYEESKPRWISVEERLPNKAEQIVDSWFSADVIGKDEVTIRKAYYNFTAGVWLDANCEMEWDSITHWMPLPAPPKGET